MLLCSDENQDVDASRSPSENYKSIKWNENLAKDLLKTYTSEAISVSCKHFNGKSFEGFVGDEVQPPMIIEERPKQIISCSENGKSLRDSPVCDILGGCLYSELNTTVATRRAYRRKLQQRKNLKPLRRSRSKHSRLKKKLRKYKKRHHSRKKRLHRKKRVHGKRRAGAMSSARRHARLLKKSKD